MYDREIPYRPSRTRKYIPRLTWESRGLKIDDEYFSHLHFADDILICAKTPHELQQMHTERWKLHMPDTERYSTRDKNQDKDIQRRITAGWAAFAKHRDIFKGNIGICLKRHVYNSCVLPSMTRHGNMGTHHSIKEHASSRTNKAGKENVKHHIPGQKKTRDRGHRRDWTSQKTEVVLGRARQQDTR